MCAHSLSPPSENSKSHRLIMSGFNNPSIKTQYPEKGEYKKISLDWIELGSTVYKTKPLTIEQCWPPPTIRKMLLNLKKICYYFLRWCVCLAFCVRRRRVSKSYRLESRNELKIAQSNQGKETCSVCIIRVHLRMVLSSIPVFPEAVLFSLLSAQDKLSKAGTKDLLGKIFSFKDHTQHVM